MKSERITAFVLAGLLSFALGSQAHAKETHFVWEGDWSEEANWDNGLPEDGDDVVIDADCTVDFWATIPSLNSLTINALLDDSTDASEDFSVDGNVDINSGGTFICAGDLNINWGSLTIGSGAEGRFHGDVEVDYDLSLGDNNETNESAVGLFYGPVTVWGKMLIYDTMADPCMAEFHDNVYVADPFICDDGATVTFYDTLQVSDDFEVRGGTVTIKKKLSCSDITVGGTFNMEGNIDCYSITMDGGFFDVKGDYTCTVTSYGSANDINYGTFQPTQGTFIFKSGSSNPSVSETGSNWFYNVQISSNCTFGSATSVGTIRIKGNLTVDSGAELITYDNITRVGGDFLCNGTYYLGPYKPTFVFDGSGTQNLTGNVAFYHLQVESGATLNTGNYTPSVAPATLTETGYVLGHIKCTEDVSASVTASFGNIGCQVTSPAGLSSTTVTRHTGSTHSGAGHSLTRWFNINATDADNNATLRLYYRDSELNGNTEADLNIWRYYGGNWTKYTASARDASNNYVEATVEIPSGSSDWVLSDATDDQSLPVTFVSASAEYLNTGIIRLTWQVASEVDNRGFEIYRREAETAAFSQIAFVDGRGTESTGWTYSFEDRSVVHGRWYHYRIVSVSLGGEREVLVDDLAAFAGWIDTVPSEFEMSQNYPNPFNGQTQIRFRLPEATHTVVQVLDQKGSVVRSLASGTLGPGELRLIWDGRDDSGRSVPSGVYLCRVVAGSHRAIRKLLLVR